MSLFSKIKKAVIKGSKYLPALAAAVPSSKALAGAAQAFQTGASIAQGGGLSSIALGGAPVTLPGAPMSMASSLPSFPSLPGQQGGIVKTGLPLLALGSAALSGAAALATRAAPVALAAGRAALPFIKKNAAKALGWISVGALVYDAAGNLMGRTSKRQMNPLNQRAARRAIRRIKRVRKIVNSIERALPKSKSRRC